jgi:hypothetical protein
LRVVEPVPTHASPEYCADLCRELLGDLVEWMEAFWAALDTDGHALVRAGALTGQLLGRVAAIKKVPRARPWRALVQNIEDTLTSLYGVWKATLDVYAAPTPIQAQQSLRVLQGYVDAASAALGQWTAAFDRLGLAVGMSPEELVIAAFTFGISADNDSETAAQRVIATGGSRTPLPAGVSEYLRACLEMTETFGERQAFEDLIRQPHSVILVGVS